MCEQHPSQRPPLSARRSHLQCLQEKSHRFRLFFNFQTINQCSSQVLPWDLSDLCFLEIECELLQGARFKSRGILFFGVALRLHLSFAGHSHLWSTWERTRFPWALCGYHCNVRWSVNLIFSSSISQCTKRLNVWLFTKLRICFLKSIHRSRVAEEAHGTKRPRPPPEFRGHHVESTGLSAQPQVSTTATKWTVTQVEAELHYFIKSNETASDQLATAT